MKNKLAVCAAIICTVVLIATLAESANLTAPNNIPTNWLACNAASDCRIFDYLCDDGFAVNIHHYDDAFKLLCTEPGSCSVRNCTTAPYSFLYNPDCSNGVCIAKRKVANTPSAVPQGP